MEGLPKICHAAMSIPSLPKFLQISAIKHTKQYLSPCEPLKFLPNINFQGQTVSFEGGYNPDLSRYFRGFQKETNKLTAKAHQIGKLPKGNFISTNHWFSGGAMLVFGRLYSCCMNCVILFVCWLLSNWGHDGSSGMLCFVLCCFVLFSFDQFCFVWFVLVCLICFLFVCFNAFFPNPFGVIFVPFWCLILCSTGVQRCVQGRVHRPSQRHWWVQVPGSLQLAYYNPHYSNWKVDGTVPACCWFKKDPLLTYLLVSVPCTLTLR